MRGRILAEIEIISEHRNASQTLSHIPRLPSRSKPPTSPDGQSLQKPHDVEKTKRCIYNIVVNINIEKSAGHSLISKRSRAGHPNADPFPSLFGPEWHSHDALQIRVSLAHEAIRVEPRAHPTPWQFLCCASHALSTFYRLHSAAHRAINPISTLLNRSTEWFKMASC